jgi:hypothetical protein
MDNTVNHIHIAASIACKTDSDINHKGLQKLEDDDHLTVFSDQFRSVPLYIFEDRTEICLFSDFESFQKHHQFDREIDEVGFWETVLFGTPLWSRTVFKKIKQLPSASKLIINKRLHKFHIERYWHFNIHEDDSIKSKSEAAAGLHAQLSRIFDAFGGDNTYCMGLSGGIDSRLSLAYLSSRVPHEKIKLFTFGFDKRILEYQYAQTVANALGIDDVVFHRMYPQLYREALEYMPIKTCGHIAISHCHIVSFLQSILSEGRLQISNYYSDAVFGYSARLPKTRIGVNDSSYFKKLHSYRYLNPTVVEAISDDICLIASGFDESSNYSSIDEYIYVTERHSKFHMNLAYLQSQFVETVTPYADIELWKFMISVPLKYREQKILLDEIFDVFYPKLGMKNIGQMSSRYASRFSKRKDWYEFRLINLANGLLRIGTRGQLQLLNKFQTEEPERLLFTCFHEDLKAATKRFVDLGLMNSAAKAYFDRLPLRAVGADARYTLLSLDRLIYLDREGK